MEHTENFCLYPTRTQCAICFSFGIYCGPDSANKCLELKVLNYRSKIQKFLRKGISGCIFFWLYFLEYLKAKASVYYLQKWTLSEWIEFSDRIRIDKKFQMELENEKFFSRKVWIIWWNLISNCGFQRTLNSINNKSRIYLL